MNLGALISQLRREDDISQLIEAVGDIALYSRLVIASDRSGMSPGAFAASCAENFANFAKDGDWLALVGHLNQLSSPGGTGLAFIIEWSLRRDAQLMTKNETDCAASGCRHY